MESENQTRSSPLSAIRSLRYDDPLVIGAGALVLGYVIGSGRFDWLTKGAVKIVQGLGVLGLTYISQSFQQHNQRFFENRAGL